MSVLRFTLRPCARPCNTIFTQTQTNAVNLSPPTPVSAVCSVGLFEIAPYHIRFWPLSQQKIWSVRKPALSLRRDSTMRGQAEGLTRSPKADSEGGAKGAARSPERGEGQREPPSRGATRSP